MSLFPKVIEMEIFITVLSKALNQKKDSSTAFITVRKPLLNIMEVGRCLNTDIPTFKGI